MARGGIKFQMKGWRQLARNLEDLGPSLAKPTIEAALLRVAAPIVTSAKAKAPKGGTGINERKIEASLKLSSRQRRQAGAEPPNRTTVYIGVRPGPLAHLIEFGTGPRWTTGKRKRQKRGAMASNANGTPAYRGVMPPHPFIRPAWDEGKRAALDALGVILGEEIEKSAARLGRRGAKG